MERRYIDREQLAALLRSPEREHVLVIDVRGEDFVGGNIKGAVNVDSGEFYEKASVDRVIDAHITPGVTKAVLHCMFSQQRGPKCAGALAQRLQERGLTSPLPEVLILRGGMTHFLKAYHDQPDLVENYDASVWEE